MGELVGSAVLQEVVGRVSSFMLGKREDKASKGRIIERLEMALAELEFALESSLNLSITDVSLLHRRKVIKHAYTEATHLLDKHKWQAQQEDREIERISHGRSLSFLSLIGLKKDESLCLSYSDVQRFEWFADCAGKFVRDVESGCSLRHYTFCNPLVRQLLEGKTLGYKRMQGTQARHCYVWPLCSEGRGVEAELQYHYEDHKMPEKGFRLALMLRLSESTDIVGVAVKCLLSLACHFKFVTESATGEISLLPNLLDISNSYAPSLLGIQPQYIRYSDILRQDPVCCKAKGEEFCPSSSELSHILPEPVMYADFRCYFSAQEYSLLRSIDDVDRPPLELVAAVVPHLVQEGLQESYACEVTGFKEQRRDGSIQEMAEMVRSQATDHFVREPGLTDYGMLWISAHGCAYYGVQTAEDEL